MTALPLADWERCPKQHASRAQHVLECDPDTVFRGAVSKATLKVIANALGYDHRNVVEIHANARDVEVIMVNRETGDEESHSFLVDG